MRPPLHYGQKVSNVELMESVLQDVNSALGTAGQDHGFPTLSPSIFRAQKMTSTGRPLRVLALGT